MLNRPVLTNPLSKSWLPCCLVCFLLGIPLLSQPSSLQELDEYVASTVRDWEVPGLGIAVIKDGEVIFSKGYGVTRAGTRGSADRHTRFAIGSTTKAMTAAAIGMLVDEGKLRWDGRVVDHLSWFQLAGPYLTREVTVRDLLTHRAGLGNADGLWYGRDISSREILRRLRFVPSQTSMRSHFTYQNIMYAAAGELIATVSGKSWERFIQTRILDPLAMRETATTLGSLKGRNIASPHDRVDGQIVPIENASVDSVAAAGSIWSSVHDMAKWLQFLLQEDPGRLLKPETREELFKPQMIVGRDGFYPTAQLTRPHWTTYGLGWFQQDYQGRAVDFHTGSIDGMVAIAGLIRDEHLGVYVLATLDHAELRHALMLTVFDLFGKPSEKRDWSRDLKSLYSTLAERGAEQRRLRDQSRVANTRVSQDLEAFTGTYQNTLYGEVQVELRNGSLHFRVGAGLEGPLSHWHYDTFVANWAARWRGTSLITFVTATNGQIGELRRGGSRYLKRRR